MQVALTVSLKVRLFVREQFVRNMTARPQHKTLRTGSTANAAGIAKPRAMDVVAHWLEIVSIASIASAEMVLQAIVMRAQIEIALFDGQTGKADAAANDTATARTAIVSEYADEPQMVIQFNAS